MKILAITSANSGVGYHRLMMPLVHMQKDYLLITDTINDEVLEKGFNLVIINRIVTGLSVEQLIEWKNKYGFKLIVDNDDHWDLPVTHILYDRYRLNDISNKIIEYIKIADLCTCTHERLADEIYTYNKNVHILPNALPYGDEQFIDRKTESDKVRLFWSGSGTHEHDIKIVSNPFKRLIGDSKIKLVISGYNENEKDVWNKIVHYFSAGNKLDITVYKYDQVTRYMASYIESDISIIPLVDNKFNSMKSNLKVLETASKKNPAIVSNVHPYKGLPVLYVNKQSDWVKHIKELTNDPGYRAEVGNNLYEYCNTNYNFKQINERRYSIYNQLCL